MYVVEAYRDLHEAKVIAQRVLGRPSVEVHDATQPQSVIPGAVVYVDDPADAERLARALRGPVGRVGAWVQRQQKAGHPTEIRGAKWRAFSYGIGEDWDSPGPTRLVVEHHADGHPICTLPPNFGDQAHIDQLAELIGYHAQTRPGTIVARLAADEMVAAVHAAVGVIRGSLTRGDVAWMAGMLPSTLSAMVTRGQAPASTGSVGSTPTWDVAAVQEWLASRPGRGARTDLRD